MRIWSRAKAESKSMNITNALIILLVLDPLLKIKVYSIRKSAPRFLLSQCRSFVEVTALAAPKTESIESILPCIVDYPNLFLRLARLGEHQFWCGGPLFAPLPNIWSIAAISFSNNCQIASFVVLQTTQNHRPYIQTELCSYIKAAAPVAVGHRAHNEGLGHLGHPRRICNSLAFEQRSFPHEYLKVQLFGSTISNKITINAF